MTDTLNFTFRRLAACVVATFSLSLGGLAIAFGVADLAETSAGVWMREWEKQGHVSNLEQWNRAFARVNLARRLNPIDADHSANLGRLMEWLFWHPEARATDYGLHRERAAELYAEAIGKRPTWGYAWAHYAENQFLLGSQDANFLLALENAIVLAPWEPGVQRKVAWIGMATWDELPDPLRMLVKESIRRSIELDSMTNELVRFAAHFEWLDELAPMLKTHAQISTLENVRRHTRLR
ncbi:MAG: hypothetical protein GTO67_04525 [Gammaproteobacteria bacterium]|nr:hypothetical protein [Gammaproteobacteria bacterium]NIM71853.1 hypothetical protein [Gammaproteobacteria bacterium]NIN37975.1 hypothetical protein [Gammaproteobacteria bacterium]NIO23609.1 hypothetical protein [Gammaproteobacteria bacterium]NIP90387.1 hypothetical protein [Gammaproteobacteria bacterium]